MSDKLDKGHFGEQGMGFFLGSEGYFFIDGPSGAGGHAPNAGGFDGIAYSIKRDDLIILDNKSFLSSGNVSSATAIDPARNLTPNLDRMIRQVRAMPDLPAQSRILNLLEQARNSITSTGVTPPRNVRIAITNFGGNSTGITRSLAARGLLFIDMSQAPRVPAPSARIYLSKASVPALMEPVPVNELTNMQIRAGRVDALAWGTAALADKASQFSVNLQVKDALAGLTKPVAEALLQGGGALVVVGIIVTAPPGVEGAPKGRRVSSAFVSPQPDGNRAKAIHNWTGEKHWQQGGVNISHEERLFWIAPIK